MAVSPIYYGYRKIVLVKDGCERKTVIEPVYPPWYEVPPLDFFSENVVPGTLRDTRTLDYQLDPQRVVPQEELMARAEALRRGTQNVGGVAAPGWRVNPPAARPEYVVPAGRRARAPIGGQPLYQLPPGAMQPAIPGPAMAPSAGVAPGGLSSPGPVYQPPPSLPPAGPEAPSAAPGIGSQPIYPLPSGG